MMKKAVCIGAMMTVMLVARAFAQEGGSEHQVEFQRYDSYFEKNNSGLPGKTSFLVFTNQGRFDRIFHPAPVMGQNSFLPENAFDTKVVIATIVRGNFTRTYDLTKVTAKDGTLYVWYTFTDSEGGGARFNSPLILAVDRENYSRIIFMENGKRIRSIPAHISRNK
jgi:hypothetical protein